MEGLCLPVQPVAKASVRCGPITAGFLEKWFGKMEPERRTEHHGVERTRGGEDMGSAWAVWSRC